MTEQRHKTPNPKDEFIITREQMKWIREGSQMDVIDTLEDVFTRPTPAADTCQTCLSEMATFCKSCPHANENTIEKAQHHDAAIRKDERERVLKELLKEITPEWTIGNIISKIHSLRREGAP